MSTKNLTQFNDEVSATSGKDVKSTGHFNASANEKFATGTNTTKRYTRPSKPHGKLGSKGHPG